METGAAPAGHWQNVKRLFNAAVEVDASRRAELLAPLAETDPSLYQEVSSLLRAHDAAEEGFLETPAARRPEAPRPDWMDLPIGHRLAGFTLLGKLGQGSAAAVYLAHETQLDRRIALKITRDHGQSEARTLAHLDFDHIVKIHSERADPVTRTRLLCMQYVPGPSLAELLRACERKPGTHPLEVLATLEKDGAALSSSQREERARLSRLDPAEYLILLAARIAEALDYAHQRGILHLDVKPENILVSPSGRPLLSDFNVSVSQAALDADSGALLGGTRRYMAPEQGRAFDGEKGVALDHRADLYALGLVIGEMMERTGALDDGARADFHDLAADLKRIIGRSTAADPRERYATAHALRRELESTLELRRIARRLPADSVLHALASRWPMALLLLAAVLPQVAADTVNITFNAKLTVSELTLSQQLIFQRMTILYNAVMAPLIVVLFLNRWNAVRTQVGKIFAGAASDPRDLARARAAVLGIAGYVIRLTSICWIPAMLYFPVGLQLFGPPVSPAVVAHFTASFLAGWLIALSYSYLYLEYAAVRFLYPRLWQSETGIAATAARELAFVPRRFDAFQLLASAAPLGAAGLALYTGQHALCAVLIFLGGFGAYHSGRVSKRLQRALFALGADAPH